MRFIVAVLILLQIILNDTDKLFIDLVDFIGVLRFEVVIVML